MSWFSSTQSFPPLGSLQVHCELRGRDASAPGGLRGLGQSLSWSWSCFEGLVGMAGKTNLRIRRCWNGWNVSRVSKMTTACWNVLVGYLISFFWYRFLQGFRFFPGFLPFCVVFCGGQMCLQRLYCRTCRSLPYIAQLRHLAFAALLGGGRVVCPLRLGSSASRGHLKSERTGGFSD